MIRVRVTADPRLARTMKKLQDPALVEKMLENALVAGALQIVNAAKEKAPYRTRTLARSIHVGGHTDMTPDWQESGAGDIGKAGRNQRFQTRVHIGTDLIYARVQEYGGTIKAKNKPYLVFKTADGTWHRAKSVEIPAHPFLRPAADEKKQEAIRDMRDSLADQLAKVVR